ncbi:hypothetical protein A9W97_19375 [Mycobacterium gordonae]|nr:ATP-dependent Clp protease proteolytic subunit [Mycobacterium gordonae]OBJ85540.1 hypothetical protein A9W97_19375 [Mycobacterium gordonae]
MSQDDILSQAEAQGSELTESAAAPTNGHAARDADVDGSGGGGAAAEVPAADAGGSASAVSPAVSTDAAGDKPNKSTDTPTPNRTVVLAILQHMASEPDGIISGHTLYAVREALTQSNILPEDRDKTTLDIWLESPGGDAHATYKIALMLRSVASTIRVVVPDYAKSAATLLSLVADEIFMAPAAELGPLDAQIDYEQEGMTVSALDRARSLDDLMDTALDFAFKGTRMGMTYARLSRADSLTAMLDFSANFMAPVVAKLDPTILHWSNTLLSVTVEYGERLMMTRAKCRPHEAATIPKRLLEEYPTHGFVISIDEAERMGLPVRPIADYDDVERVTALHRRTEDKGVNIIRVIPPQPSSVVKTGSGEGNHDADTGSPSNLGAQPDATSGA